MWGLALADFGRDTRSTDSLRGIVFPKKTQKLLTKILGLATSGRHNSAMITDRRKFTSKWSLYGMSSFHFRRYNQFPLGYTFRTRKVPTQIFGKVRCPILRIKACRSAGAA